MHGPQIPWHHLRENNTQSLWDIQLLWRNWCEIYTLMRQSDYCEIHTKKATVWLLRNKYPYAAIRLVRATHRSTQKHNYFFMIKIAKKNYFRCRRKAALNLNGSAAMVVLLRTEQFVYFFDSLIPLYCICIIFSADPAPGQNFLQDSYQDYVGPPCTQQYGKKSWSL